MTLIRNPAEQHAIILLSLAAFFNGKTLYHADIIDNGLLERAAIDFVHL